MVNILIGLEYWYIVSVLVIIVNKGVLILLYWYIIKLKIIIYYVVYSFVIIEELVFYIYSLVDLNLYNFIFLLICIEC